jgi:hypothetical protein
VVLCEVLSQFAHLYKDVDPIIGIAYCLTDAQLSYKLGLICGAAAAVVTLAQLQILKWQAIPVDDLFENQTERRDSIFYAYQCSMLGIIVLIENPKDMPVLTIPYTYEKLSYN